MSTIFPIVAESVEAAIDPNNKLTFLLDWELTLKCNLDCKYCTTGIVHGHDNSIPHPPLKDCLETVDFMFNYVNIYMKHKAPWSRHVILNVYGGESLYHPNIIEILEYVRRQHIQYKDQWTLTVTTTTNAVVSTKQMHRLVDLIDEFTVSYHTESTPQQQQQVRDNLLLLKEKNSRAKCVILMHPKEENFADNLAMIEFCKDNEIRYLPRQLDHPLEDTSWNYKDYQVVWFDKYYKQKSFTSTTQVTLPGEQCDTNLADIGRACCGGRQLVQNQDFKNRMYYVQNKFPGWSCSVNWFFVYIKQVTKEVFVNKDCRMDFDGNVGPIGHLNKANELLQDLEIKLTSKTLPTIKCKINRCQCGLCAPKAEKQEYFDKIMEKYKI